MLIKDLLTELIDDGLVNMEKCGTTNLYWCFKYDRVKNLIKDQENVEKKIEVRLKDKISLIEQIQAAKLLRKKKSEFGDRDKLLGKLKRLQLRKKDLEPQMQAIDENDPEKLEKIYKHNLKLKDGIDFFTETIEEMIYYFTKVAACPVDEKSLRGELDIPIEFEDTSQVML
ncbi:uncharacterized protein PRCAT00002065001 [Priceomyces carsonii]|uniref:uncharacterized protein n=1 Tax=Priceomyces carsonii TaxID=28549 RepID=UPI002ED7D865|nr:unnamed protein product [Priceomyces carsonii]